MELAATKPQKILIVDDDRNIRALVRQCLEQDGYKVKDVNNGADALECVQTEPPDLILLDLAMPIFDGMSVLAVAFGDGRQRSQVNRWLN